MKLFLFIISILSIDLDENKDFDYVDEEQVD